MLETLLTLPGFIYQADGKYYFLGKWICKECTDVDATDCVTNRLRDHVPDVTGCKRRKGGFPLLSENPSLQ